MTASTRVDMSARFELVENRMKYLQAEQAKIQVSLDALQRERNLLDELRTIYADTPTDPIDTERKELFGRSTPPPVRKLRMGLPSSILSEIQYAGCALSTRQLTQRLSNPPGSIANAVFRLKRGGYIRSVADGKYEVIDRAQ